MTELQFAEFMDKLDGLFWMLVVAFGLLFFVLGVLVGRQR